MKSSTYASLVTIIFLKHKYQISKSIESAIKSTDQLCKELGLKDDLSHMTKYRIISDMIQSKILITKKTKKNKKLRLTKRIANLF